MAYNKKVELVDLTPEQRREIDRLARICADNFFGNTERQELVQDISRTRTDESFKVNMKALDEIMKYNDFAPEASKKILELW